MCLDYGTPKRLREARLGLREYPPECGNKEMLLALLREELDNGCYDDATVFHPLLRIMLRGLVANHDRLFHLWQEPKHMFCDVVQALGIPFGFINGRSDVPGVEAQEVLLYARPGWTHPYVFMVVRNILQACCQPEDVAPWTDVLPDLWLTFAGKPGTFIEAAMRYPDLIQVEVA